MKPIVEKARRFGSMQAWANRILRVGLSNMRIGVQETASYVPDLFGARGIAARICWDEYPEPVGAVEKLPPPFFPGSHS